MTETSASSPIAVLQGTFQELSEAKRAERELGTLCSEGPLELLDGALIDWPTAEPSPVRRTLRNVPRVAALGGPAWAVYLDRISPGSSAVVVFVPTEHQMAVVDRLSLVGAEVTAVTLSAVEYDRLRRV